MDADEAERTAASTAPAVHSVVYNGRDFCPEEQDRKAGEVENTTKKTSVTADEKKVSRSPEPKIEEKSSLENHSTPDESPEATEMPDASQASKRSLEKSTEVREAESQSTEKEVPWKKVTIQKKVVITRFIPDRKCFKMKGLVDLQMALCKNQLGKGGKIFVSWVSRVRATFPLLNV